MRQILPLIALYTVVSISGCGGRQCNLSDRIVRDPSCRTLGLSLNKTVKGSSAVCTGINYHKAQVNCIAASGSSAQCTAIANRFPVFMVVVPNNNSGSFISPSNPVPYSDCGTLLGDLSGPTSVKGIAGIYISDESTATERMNCNSSGCTLGQSVNCFAGWDDTTVQATTHAAQLNGNYLVCAYIDNSALGSTAPPAIGTSNFGTGPMQSVSLAGTSTLILNTWVDTY